MAITVNNVQTTDTGSGTSATLTLNYTPTSGSDACLFVAVAIANGNAITDVTFNGTAMTEVGNQVNGLNCRAAMYRTTSPGTSAADIVLTMAAANRMAMVAATLLGVDQTTPFDTSQGTTGNSQDATIAYTGGADGDTVFCSIAKRNSTETGLTAGTDTTKDGEDNTTNSTASNNVICAAGHENRSGTTTISMNWSGTSNRQWAITAATANPAAGGGGDVYSGRGIGRGVMRGVGR